MEDSKLRDLKLSAREIRKLTLDSIAHLGVGHVGGAMSIIDLLALLYGKVMTVDPSQPQMPDRDRLVLSKGHAGPALYATLAYHGYFPREWMKTLNTGGTNLPSHCDRNLTPGIDMTTGSLGQGLSAGLGLTLGNRLDGRTSWVYVIQGDGECNEGQVWEAAMCASHFGVERLITFIDYNKMQIDGYTYEIMNLDDLAAKWRAFGWHVLRVDGHDIHSMDAAIALAKTHTRAPTAIILDSVKGKGASFAEGKVDNHNMPVTAEMLREAIAKLDAEII